MIRDSILFSLIAAVSTITAARADIGGYQSGVQQKFHDDSQVVSSKAEWETHFGKPGLHLFAPYKNMFPRAAALIQPNPGTDDISVSNVTFSISQKQRGRFGSEQQIPSCAFSIRLLILRIQPLKRLD